jgi:lipid A 3-O-deacylase
MRLDNDAFNFWTPPWNRPDEEYTSGVHIGYEHDGRTFVLGQDIYTPGVSRMQPEAETGARPNAGWLFVRDTRRRWDDARLDELALTFGVTGPPSLARFTQQVAHAFAPSFNRPTDWRRQIAFEPGVIVRYEQTRRMWASEAGPFGFDLLPHAALAGGNVSDVAELGMRARGGFHLAHPWIESASGDTRVTVSVGLSERGVARDLFLDGNTFRSSPRVGHEPFVHSRELAVELDRGWLRLTYETVTDSRLYAAGPSRHAWSSMRAAVAW